MDRERFDALVRLCAASSSRRAALAALLGAGVFGTAAGAAPKKGKGRKRKARKRGGKGTNGKAKRAAISAEATCASPGPSSNLNGCNFNNRDFAGIDLSSSAMRETRFRGADLCGADLSSSNLRDADFRGFGPNQNSGRPTNLFHADLSSSGCAGARFNARTLFCRTRTCNGSFSDRDCPAGVDPADVCCGDADCGPGAVCCGEQCAAGTWSQLTTFGAPGDGPAQLDLPEGMAVSADGLTAWVADSDNNRVAVWTRTGPAAWEPLTTFGEQGDGPGQLESPFGVAVADDERTVWVADRVNHRVAVWTRSGPETWEPLTTFGEEGAGPGQLRFPNDVAVADDGRTVWVADSANDRISVWTKQPDGSWAPLTTFGDRGDGPGQFEGPASVAVVDDGQTVWVADRLNDRVSIWTRTGPAAWDPLTTFGSGPGGGSDELDNPNGVAVADDGRTVWVADTDNNRVAVWTRTGPETWELLTILGPGQFNEPGGVAVSGDGLTAWVADTRNNRVSVWQLVCPGA